jgi:hypothetical protein
VTFEPSEDIEATALALVVIVKNTLEAFPVEVLALFQLLIAVRRQSISAAVN